jgi:hypothetical protein
VDQHDQQDKTNNRNKIQSVELQETSTGEFKSVELQETSAGEFESGGVDTEE